MNLEYRDATAGEVRSIDDATRQVVARVCTFNAKPDTYGTTWKSGVFTDSLRSQLPVVCWGHDQRNVVGSVVGYEEQPDGLDVTIQFANPDDVPQARAAYSLIKDGHIKGWSFGFANAKSTQDPQYRGAVQFVSADLYEVSPVVRASVPGTRTISVRSAEGDGTREISEETLSAMISAEVAAAVADGKRSVTVDVADDGAVTVEEQQPTITEDSVRSMIAEAIEAQSIPDAGSREDDAAATLAGAVDAALDQAAVLIDGEDTSTLSDGLRQALELVSAAGVAADALLDEMGIDDPDDGDDGGRSTEPVDLVGDDPYTDESGERATVSSKPWSDFTQADYSDAQWKAACLITGPDKSDCKLPIREPDGTLNSNGVHAAAGRLGQTDAPPAEKQAAAKALMSAYSTMGEKPPPTVLAAASGKRSEDDPDALNAEAEARLAMLNQRFAS